jgi:hypothetical protein
MPMPSNSVEPSFVSPSKGGRDDLLSKMRGQRHPMATPRNPLAQLRQPYAKQEFTPLLKSATKKKLLAQDREDEYRYLQGRLVTPAALKPGYKFDNSPGLPEASVVDETTASSDPNRSMSVPPVASSSAISTPLALPRKGEERVLENGNVLTLREQEAVCYKTRI